MSGFTLIACTVFGGSAALAIGTMAHMFVSYRHKMVAALRFEPKPRNAQVAR